MTQVGCSLCDGHGYIRNRKGNISLEFDWCSCIVEHESLKETVKNWKISGLSNKIMQRYDVTNWKAYNGIDFSVESLINIMESDVKPWLFFSGPTGSGKTYAVVIASKIALLKERTVFFINVPELMDLLRPSNGGEDRRQVVLDHCKEVDLLILDDIGQEKASDWVREQLFIIINSRYNNAKQTIFTSNFPLVNIKKTISPAVYSRIAGESAEIALVTSEDKRLS